jgi:hypothetical protein
VLARETFLAGTEPPRCDEHGDVIDHALDVWRRLRDWFSR